MSPQELAASSTAPCPPRNAQPDAPGKEHAPKKEPNIALRKAQALAREMLREEASYLHDDHRAHAKVDSGEDLHLDDGDHGDHGDHGDGGDHGDHGHEDNDEHGDEDHGHDDHAEDGVAPVSEGAGLKVKVQKGIRKLGLSGLDVDHGEDVHADEPSEPSAGRAESGFGKKKKTKKKKTKKKKTKKKYSYDKSKVQTYTEETQTGKQEAAAVAKCVDLSGVKPCVVLTQHAHATPSKKPVLSWHVWYEDYVFHMGSEAFSDW
jgi:hypothetical protein